METNGFIWRTIKMKSMKIKVTATALTAMMTMAASGCTLKLNGDTKQIESMFSEYADKVQVVVEDDKAAPAVQTDLDGNGNIVEATTVETTEAVLPSDMATETAPSETVPVQRETPAPTMRKESEVTKSPESKVTEPQETQAPTETEIQVTEPEETTVPETTPEQTAPNVVTDTNDPLAPRWAYKDIIDAYDENARLVKFSLLHLDADEIPELVIYDTTDYDNGGELTVYTYRDGEAKNVLDRVYSGSGVYYTYAPYKNTICKNVTYNDVYATPTIYTLEQLMNNQPGYVSGSEMTPGMPLEGYASGYYVNDCFRNCHIPADEDFFDMTKPYEPGNYHVEDYAKYAGCYTLESETVKLWFSEPDDRGYVQISLWFYRTGSLEQVKIPIYDNYAVFYYQGFNDRNQNFRIDPGERFYRKATIELQEYGVKLVFEDCSVSDIEPLLDLSEEFCGCQYIDERTYFFSLQFKS